MAPKNFGSGLNNFVKPIQSDDADSYLAAKPVALGDIRHSWEYHTTKHNQSYLA